MMRQMRFIVSQIIQFCFLASIMLVSFLTKNVVHATPETVVKVDPNICSVNIGETFTINVTILDVQNLYGIELVLFWNASLLMAVNVDLRLGVESHSNGVLHELPSAHILVTENNVTQKEGKYYLTAMSVSPAPSFYGSGNIVRITFNGTNFGESKLVLETKFGDYPPPDREPRVSWPINHATIDGFTVIIPEIPDAAFLIVFMISAALVVALSRNVLKKSFSSYNINPNEIN